ncbi:MAG TPA: protease SohB [Nevskiaceae bacterium]|nr:protease SohB [Nevskiaceae bacterium]
MSAFLLDYGLFLAKTLTLLLALVAAVVVIGSAIAAGRREASPRPRLRHLNQLIEQRRAALEDQVLEGGPALKAARRQRKQAAKARAKAAHRQPRPRLFVLDFTGDLQASAVTSLREEISCVVGLARPGDEVLLRLESPGGLVHGYGLAASQLVRLRRHGLPLTVAVDKVAASGGYLMACVASRIVAAPFAILGSIGVVAQIPNVHRLLKKNDVDVELHTAGAYKRTLTVLGENTEAGRAKFREELEDTHRLFQEFVAEHRPVLDLATVATGEHWFGQRALALKLVDELATSDDWLLRHLDSHEVYELQCPRRRRLGERLGERLRAWLGAAPEDLAALRLPRLQGADPDQLRF